MNNFRGHLTLDLLKLYMDKKIKVLSRLSYASLFNIVENVLLLIKNITYKKLYKSIDILIQDIVNENYNLND